MPNRLSAADGLLEAPEVNAPTVTVPVDCMPDILAAGRVAPVVRIPHLGGIVWDVCDPQLARAALTDPRLRKDVDLIPDWLKVPGDLLGSMPPVELARNLAMCDGDEHTRIRRAHARVFTPRNNAIWAQRLAELTTELLDRLSADGGVEVDLVARYTHPLPLTFLGEVLGLPAHLNGLLSVTTNEIIYSAEQAVRARAVMTLNESIAGWAKNPEVLSEGLITGLLERVDDEADVTVHEIVAWTFGVVIAGYETTASLISSAILEALRRPAGERPMSPGDVEVWVEETLRVHPSATHATWRFATEDLNFGGYLIPRGAPVQINLAAANRCPQQGTPDEFRPDLGLGHLSFGLGRHYCLGAALARLEARTAVSAFLARFPNASLSPSIGVSWESQWMARRITALPVVVAGLDCAG